MLIGDRLTIHGERVLRVIAHSVKQTVGIRRDARRGQCDQRTQRRGRTLQRNLVKESAIHVGVESRIILYQVPSTFDGHTCGRSFHREVDFQRQRYSGTNLNVLRVSSKSGRADAEVVGIEWNVRNAEPPRVIRGCRSRESADRVVNFYRGIRYHRTGGINNRSIHCC